MSASSLTLTGQAANVDPDNLYYSLIDDAGLVPDDGYFFIQPGRRLLPFQCYRTRDGQLYPSPCHTPHRNRPSTPSIASTVYSSLLAVFQESSNWSHLAQLLENEATPILAVMRAGPDPSRALAALLIAEHPRLSQAIAPSR
jgi:hypothetical protein